jgi:hypothetical protein
MSLTTAFTVVAWALLGLSTRQHCPFGPSVDKLSVLTPPGQPTASFSFTMLPLFILLLSPPLKTLTKAITSDSIWALSAMLLSLNALLSSGDTPHRLGGLR